MAQLALLPGFWDLPAVRNGRVYLVNGSDYFSRPGPRLADSLELLASLIHPELFGEIQFGPEQAVRWNP